MNKRLKLLQNLHTSNRRDSLRKLAIDSGISLNIRERNIFELLMRVVNEKTPNTVLRVAGGWVRDKLLGKDSHDIDIAINNMSGAEFAKLVVEYMNENNIDVDGISIVKANPDQSKHLETAMINIFGLPIDFVSLRSESYSDDSRIPEIKPGTPEEDAARRDLTINALFYNINEEKIEDFTGKGISDLKNGIIRTPIDSVQTFIDDPLRVLRAIRFASKYGFDLSPEIIQAAKHPRVQNAFKNKISKERIWKEMVGEKEPGGWKQGFLTGPNPSKAAQMLAEIGLRDVLLYPTEEELARLEMNQGFSHWDTDQNSPHHDLSIWDHTLSVLDHLVKHETTPERHKNAEDIVVRNLSALLHDIGKCDLCSRQSKEDGTYSYIGHEVSSAKLAEIVLRRLGAPNNIISRVTKLVKEHMRLHTLSDTPSDKSLRKWVRDLAEDWEHSLEIAKADAYGKMSAKDDPSIGKRYENFRDRIKELIGKHDGQLSIPRPIDGNDLIKELGFKPGPNLGKALKALDEELLGNPDMTKKEALDFIRKLNLN